MTEEPCPVVFRSHGPGEHFFGYYDKSPLDRGGRRLLTHRADFDTKRMPRAGDELDVGYWDLETGIYHVVARTRAFNWQQGAQLQWLPPDHERRIVFNDREGDRLVARVVDVESGETRTLPYPVYTLHPGGGAAICVNFERLAFTHPGYCYEGPSDPRWDGPAPEGDGLFRMDLETGALERVVALEEVAGRDPLSTMAGGRHYLEHALYGPDGSRLCFLHRCQLEGGGIHGRLYTCDDRGGDLRCLLDAGFVSHCGWRGPRELTAWARPRSAVADLRRSRALTRLVVAPLRPLYDFAKFRLGMDRKILTRDTYLLCDVETGTSRPLAPSVRFSEDGHCTWRPGDPRWMLTDTYDDPSFHRDLLLYDHEAGRLLRVGRFHSPPETCRTGFRCDLHPRWDHSGTRVVIDSMHEDGGRQVYVLDVSGVVGRAP